MSTNNFEDFVLWWNNTFPYDKLYRKKYKIGFGSPEHRQLCQIDIFTDIYEDSLIEKYFDEINAQDERDSDYRAGKLWREDVETVDGQKAMELFDKIDFSKMGKDPENG